MSEPNAAAAAGKQRHPKGLSLLFVTEMAERFSYYGMRCLLTLYLVAVFFSDSMASQIYGSYSGLVYLTPLIGGYLADRYWGNRRSIIIGGIVMAVGELCMFLSACFAQQSIFTLGGPIDPTVDNSIALFFLFTGLVTIIVGNGFFKPNISTMVGDLYEPTDTRKDAAFTIFYMGINVGAFIAPFICGSFQGSWDNLAPFKWGFLCACIAMVISVAVFWALKDKYLVTPEGLGIGLPPKESKLRELKDHQAEVEAVKEHTHAEGEENADAEKTDGTVETAEAVHVAKNSPLRLVGCILGMLALFFFFSPLWGLVFDGVHGGNFNDYISAAVYAFGIVLPVFIITDASLTRTERSRIGVIYIVAVFVIFFWSAFEQAGSSLTLFADRQVDRDIMGWEFKTTYFQSINPICVVVFAPVLAMLWTKLAKLGKEPASIVKQAIGLALLSIGYIVIAVATKGVDPSVKISMFWLVTLYFLHTIGELCLSPIGLSMVNKLAPARFASLLMGVWFMSNAAANIFAGKLATLLPSTDPNTGAPVVQSFLGFEIATLDSFFFLFAIMAGIASILLFALSPVIIKMMKGVK